MSAPVRQYSFSSGEIAPTLYARTDLNRYENGLRTCRNMIVMRHGGATGRPGTEYIGTTLNAGQPVRLASFIFNETGLGQSYVLEFGNKYIAFYQNGGNVIVSSAAITGVTVANPAVVTAPVHGFSNGDIITISGIIGTTQLDNGYFIVQNVTTNTFTLADLFGNVINIPNFGGLNPYISGGIANKIYILPSPYTQPDLAGLKFAESADIITIVHPQHLPMELQRLAATNWILVPVAFQPQVLSPSLLTTSGGNSTTDPEVYAVACVSQSNEEGFATVIIPADIGASGAADPTHPVTVAFNVYGTVGASSFRIYKALGSAPDAFGYIATVTGTSFRDYGVTPDFTNSPILPFNPFVPPESPVINWLGFILLPGQPVTYAYAVTAIIAGVETAPTFVYSGLPLPPNGTVSGNYFGWQAEPTASGYNVYRNNGAGGTVYGLLYSNISSTTVLDRNLASPNFAINPPHFDDNYNPTTVGFVQQRRGFGSTLANPIGFWMSQTGRYYNFTAHVGATDSDAIFSSLAGEEVNAIQYLIELKFMLILSAGAEIFVNGNGNNVVTPSAINAVTQSQYGCSPLKPLKIGDVLLFNQALGSFIRDFSFDFAIDGYHGNDITVFSSHLFEGFQMIDWAFQKVPDSIVWVVRSDGMLLSCTYLREQQILAWARHDFVNGFVENVVSIPENGAYAVYFVIRRVINGVTVRYLERLSSRIWSDPINATYLDSFEQYVGDQSSSGITATLQLRPPDTSYQQGTGTEYLQFMNIMFSSPVTLNIGDQIFLYDALFLSSQGASGNQIRFTIEGGSGTGWDGYPSGPVPVEFQSVPISTWARAVKTISGLGYLVGQKVSIWADRFLVASPLNSRIPTVYTVPLGGTLTLDKPYSNICIGLPMTQDIQTLDLEAYFGETLLGKRKRVSSLGIFLYNTRSFFAGSEDPDTNLNNAANDPLFELYEERSGAGQVTYDQPPPLITDQDYVIVPSRWNKNGRLFLRNVDPIPFSLLALSPREEDSPTVPAYAKRV